MYSDDSYHSESELYYPDELNVEGNQPISASISHIENDKTGEIASDIEDFILSKGPENTMKKNTKYDMNICKGYFDSENDLRDIENIPADELNVHICRFFMQAKKKNGTAYEPNTLICFLRGLQRYLNDNSSSINVFKDQAFNKGREVLSAKRKVSRCKRKRKRKSTASCS